MWECCQKSQDKHRGLCPAHRRCRLASCKWEESMKPKKDTHKVGVRAKRRGQQMGTAGAADQNRKEMTETPAVLGRRKVANKLAADKSAQHTGGDAVTPRTTSPSTPAMTGGAHKGESGGETAFKARLKKKRPAKATS